MGERSSSVFLGLSVGLLCGVCFYSGIVFLNKDVPLDMPIIAMMMLSGIMGAGAIGIASEKKVLEIAGIIAIVLGVLAFFLSGGVVGTELAKTMPTVAVIMVISGGVVMFSGVKKDLFFCSSLFIAFILSSLIGSYFVVNKANFEQVKANRQQDIKADFSKKSP